jgi:hypothetical protein
METSELTIRLIVLLIPGLIAALMIETLTVHTKWSQFRFVLYSILLGYASYFSYQAFEIVRGVVCWAWTHTFSYNQLSFWGSLFSPKVPISLREVFVTCVFSILLGMVMSGIIQYKVVNRIARWLRISEKYGDENLFSFFLNAKEISWIWVRIPSKNLTYEGYRESFSETETIREVVLRDVKVYRYEDSEFLYEIPAIYLCLPVNDIIIEMPKQPGKEDSSEKSDTTQTTN